MIHKTLSEMIKHIYLMYAENFNAYDYFSDIGKNLVFSHQLIEKILLFKIKIKFQLHSFRN